jgi:flavodoxin
MKKVLISYWSSSGNTEAMAKQVAQGATEAEAVLKNVAETTPDLVKGGGGVPYELGKRLAV